MGMVHAVRKRGVRPPETEDRVSLSSPIPAMASSVLTSSVSSQGFHFTLSTTVSNTHEQNADNCSLHILYELDPHVYADQYELAQRPGYSLLLWGTSDLEKPVSAVDPSGSVLLLTAHSYSLLQNGDTNVTIDLPLHARYPNPSTAAETPYHHISLQRPVGFFACSKGRSSESQLVCREDVLNSARRRILGSRCATNIYLAARMASGLPSAVPHTRPINPRDLPSCCSNRQIGRLGLGRHGHSSRYDRHVLLPFIRIHTNCTAARPETHRENRVIMSKQVSVQYATRADLLEC